MIMYNFLAFIGLLLAYIIVIVIIKNTVFCRLVPLPHYLHGNALNIPPYLVEFPFQALITSVDVIDS
jgi:hypothetical protein